MIQKFALTVDNEGFPPTTIIFMISSWLSHFEVEFFFIILMGTVQTEKSFQDILEDYDYLELLQFHLWHFTQCQWLSQDTFPWKFMRDV